MNNFRCYEEYPYFDMKAPCSHNTNCGCNPCYVPPKPNLKPCNNHYKHPCQHIPPCNNLFPPMCNPEFSQIEKCENNELLYLLSGIIIGKSLN